ncbi:GNAT family N-acetyltransferase [Marinicrinis sediminis]|uniref:GNAT family N-acetyltransferase n=1 Tax=Marinicrinis sediminis TaxID=1652465 RepID=A0ABW5RD41_9BACL
MRIRLIKNPADHDFIFRLVKDEILPHATAVRRREVDMYWTRAHMRKRLRAGRTWVAVKQGRSVGLVHAVVQSQAVWVDLLAVLRSEQGSGIGEKLLKRVFQYASYKKQKTVQVAVDGGNTRAMRFYEKHGFRIVDYIPEWDVHVMRRS